MLTLDMYEWHWVRLEERITIDVRKDNNVGLATLLEQERKMICVCRTPINRQSRRIEALQLRHIVLRTDGSFDGSGMRISEGMTVIGSEEMMRNSSIVEFLHGQPMPHPLTVARLEMMRATIRPHIDVVEAIRKFLEKKKMQPDRQNKMIVILVRVGAVAEEINILAYPLT